MTNFERARPESRSAREIVIIILDEDTKKEVRTPDQTLVRPQGPIYVLPTLS